jgi:hypothetical protein
VYGENLQCAVGLNHQIAFGNNLQICINPLGLIAGVPEVPLAPLITAALGSGIGGNMQFTIGSSTSFVLGQSFDINIGPPKIEIKGGPGKAGNKNPGNYGKHIATDILCAIVGATVLVWVIVYGCERNDYHRATESMVFQLLVNLLLMAIMEVEILSRQIEDDDDDVLKTLFRTTDASKRLDADQNMSLLSFLTGIGILLLITAPIMATSSEVN